MSRLAGDRDALSTKRCLPIPFWVWLTCLALAAFKLWLTAGQAVFAIGHSAYDDWHFLVQASHLLHGEWLGPYDQLTLIKGPFLSMWIAFAFIAGVPLLLSAQLLYAASCWLLTAAIRPLLNRNIYMPFLYAVLLFNPESAGVTRVLRELISPALTVLVAACSAGLLIAEEGDHPKAGWWAAGLGASFAALWLTREEGMVVVPFLVFVFACSILLALRMRVPGNIWRVLRMWLVSFLVWAALVYSVAAINLVHYGLFAKTEFDAFSFNAAYGALSRVKAPVFKPLVPVSNRTRLLIYRMSPAFSELRPYLEGAIGLYWEQQTEYMQDRSNHHEILGPWFVWAFRDAVSAAGYYEAGKYPEAYYLRLAGEVNSACDRHLLDCYAARATFIPVWHNAYVRPLLAAFGSKLGDVVALRGVGLDPIPSDGTPEELALFRGLTGNQLTTNSPSTLAPELARLNGTRFAALQEVLRTYQRLNPVMAVVALLAYAALTVTAVRRRNLDRLWMVLTAFAVLCVSRIALVSFIHISSMKIPGVAYLEEAFPIMLGFTGMACLAALNSFIALRKWKVSPPPQSKIDPPTSGQ